MAIGLEAAGNLLIELREDVVPFVANPRRRAHQLVWLQLVCAIQQCREGDVDQRELPRRLRPPDNVRVGVDVALERGHIERGVEDWLLVLCHGGGDGKREQRDDRGRPALQQVTEALRHHFSVVSCSTRSMTKTLTGPRAGSSFRPSCSCTAVRSGGPAGSTPGGGVAPVRCASASAENADGV